MTFVLGLTGSIGMGKSTTAQMFRDLHVPVWDADATVHRLYARGGAALPAIENLVPGAVTQQGVDRDRLRQAIEKEPALLAKIESVVHPLVAQDRRAFLSLHSTASLVVLDIPLLFETGGDADCDATLVVTTDPVTQRKRVLERGIPVSAFEDLLSRQMPDAEKRSRATYIICSNDMDETRRHVSHLVEQLRKDTISRESNA